ncbi:MAG: peptidylprolyl isomerase [Candidatus Eremiobacteraeota bacterium]|nr:peptidylprolyl isomerase [Candidatus Eremiobacteraeota bacterium]
MVSLLLKALAITGAVLLIAAGLITIPRHVLDLEQQRSLGEGSLVTLLASQDESTAARAALAIGRTKQRGGVSPLEKRLSAHDDGVRAMSVYALGLIGLGSGSDTIVALAERDASGAVRVAALDAIGRYEAAKSLSTKSETLAQAAASRVLVRDADAIVRGRAAITLGFFAEGPRGADAANALTSALRIEKDDAVRERIMWTIFRRYAARVPRAVLAGHLQDSDEIVRIEAARAFGKLKDSSAIPALTPLLADRSWRVQEQAAESIRVLLGKKPTDHWTAIPQSVHTPAPNADMLASLPVLVPEKHAKPVAPNLFDAATEPAIDPHTARDMTGPAPGRHPRVRIVTTRGNVYVVLYPEWAPMTVLNFLNLAQNGFYSNNPWFRIVPDFVVQTGEKDAKNAPGPGYTIRAEENPVEQSSYVISMGLDYDAKTNTPKRDSAGSEYYITLSPQYHLDNDFSVFGEVTGGADVLGRLVESDKVVRIERIADVTL